MSTPLEAIAARLRLFDDLGGPTTPPRGLCVDIPATDLAFLAARLDGTTLLAYLELIARSVIISEGAVRRLEVPHYSAELLRQWTGLGERKAKAASRDLQDLGLLEVHATEFGVGARGKRKALVIVGSLDWDRPQRAQKVRLNAITSTATTQLINSTSPLVTFVPKRESAVNGESAVSGNTTQAESSGYQNVPSGASSTSTKKKEKESKSFNYIEKLVLETSPLEQLWPNGFDIDKVIAFAKADPTGFMESFSPFIARQNQAADRLLIALSIPVTQRGVSESVVNFLLSLYQADSPAAKNQILDWLYSSGIHVTRELAYEQITAGITAGIFTGLYQSKTPVNDWKAWLVSSSSRRPAAWRIFKAVGWVENALESYCPTGTMAATLSRVEPDELDPIKIASVVPERLTFDLMGEVMKVQPQVKAFEVDPPAKPKPVLSVSLPRIILDLGDQVLVEFLSWVVANKRVNLDGPTLLAPSASFQRRLALTIIDHEVGLVTLWADYLKSSQDSQSYESSPLEHLPSHIVEGA